MKRSAACPLIPAGCLTIVVWAAFGTLAATHCTAATPIPIEVPNRSRPVEFESDIAPILRSHCLACHNVKQASGGLNLESAASILKGGEQGPAVVAGSAADSLLLKVAAHQQEPVMPPPDNMVDAKPLTPPQLGLLKLWIDQGAASRAATARETRWQSLPRGYHPALAVAVTPDGQCAIGSRGNRLTVYHLPTASLVTELVDPSLNVANDPAAAVAHHDLVRCLALNPAGDLLASGSYREVKLWRRPRIARLAELPHDAEIHSIAASADHRWIATGDGTGRLRLWDRANSRQVHAIAAHQSAITGIAFAPAGDVVYSSGTDKSLRAWTVASGQPLGSATETASPIQSVALVNKGDWLVTGGQDGLARVWDAAAVRGANNAGLKPLRELKAHAGAVSALSPLPGHLDQFLSGGEDGWVRRWQGSSDKPLSELRIEGPVTALAASHEGRHIAAAGTAALTLWNGKGQPIAQLGQDPRRIAAIASQAAGIEFTRSAVNLAHQDLKSYEGLIRIAKVRTEDVKKAEDELAKVQKTRDEKRAALDKVKAENGKVEPAEKALADAETAVTVAGTVIERAKAIAERTARELADAEQAVAAREELLKRQEADRAAAMTEANSAPLAIRSLAFSHDGRRLIAGGEGGEIHSFNAETGHWSQSLSDHQTAIRALCATADGKLVSGSADRRVLIWDDPGQWRLERVIGKTHPAEGLADRVLSVDFSRNGQWLATAGGVPSRTGELKIWNVADGRLVREIQDAHSETIFAVRFSPAGDLLASAGGDRMIRTWEASTGTAVRRLAGHTGQVLALSWKADGKLLVSAGSDQVLKLWDLDKGVPIRTMKGTTYRIGPFKRDVTAVTFIGDSEQFLAAAGDGTVRLHRTTSDNDILTFAGSRGYQHSVATTPDGRFAIAGGSDGTIRIWSGHEQQPKQTLTPVAE